MSATAHDKIACHLFNLAGYVRAKGGKVTHAPRVYGARRAQAMGLDDQVRRVRRGRGPPEAAICSLTQAPCMEPCGRAARVGRLLLLQRHGWRARRLHVGNEPCANSPALHPHSPSHPPLQEIECMGGWLMTEMHMAYTIRALKPQSLLAMASWPDAAQKNFRLFWHERFTAVFPERLVHLVVPWLSDVQRRRDELGKDCPTSYASFAATMRYLALVVLQVCRRGAACGDGRAGDAGSPQALHAAMAALGTLELRQRHATAAARWHSAP